MLPTNTDGTPWSHDAARMAMDVIRDDVSAALTGRDRSRGIPESGHVYVQSDASATSATQRLVVDPILAAKKHTGGEHKRLVLARWAKFCATQKSEQEFMATMVPKEEARRTATIEAAAETEASLTAELPDTSVEASTEDQPAKRRVGRPTNEEKAARQAEPVPVSA